MLCLSLLSRKHPHRRTRCRSPRYGRSCSRNVLGAHYRELDVPLKVEWQDGLHETILFILEEETNWHRFSLHRLGSYCFELAELCKSDCVVPVVIFLHEADSVPASLTLGPKHRSYVTLDYLACKLKAIPYESWQYSDNLVARLNLPNMHIPAGHEINVYHQAIQGLKKLEPDRDKQAKYVDFIDIYARLTDNQLQQWQQQYPEESTTMTGFAPLKDTHLPIHPLVPRSRSFIRTKRCQVHFPTHPRPTPSSKGHTPYDPSLSSPIQILYRIHISSPPCHIRPYNGHTQFIPLAMANRVGEPASGLPISTGLHTSHTPATDKWQSTQLF